MSEWVEKPLGLLAKFQKGRKVATSDYEQAGYDVYLGASSLGGAIEGYASTRLAVLVEPGDVLMLWDGERSGLVGYGLCGVVSSTVQRLIPSKEITGTYLYYHLLSRFDWIQGRRTGTGVPHVPKDLARIMNVQYPVNPIEQERITDILVSIDRTIEKTESLIVKYQQIKAGLMHDLFTRGVTADGKLRPPRGQTPELYQETPIGWIPKEWIFTTCDKVCEKIIDCKNRTPPEMPDGHPVIRTPNVRNGEFVDDELLFTDNDSYAIWTARGKPVAGDVVITREAPVGEVCMIPARHPEACLGQRMMLYRPNADVIHPAYFLFALQSRQIQNRLDLISGGSTVGHVRVGDIRELWMFMPSSHTEQEQIAASLTAARMKVEAEQQQCDKLRHQKLGLMHDLLTGYVRVPAVKAKEVSTMYYTSSDLEPNT